MDWHQSAALIVLALKPDWPARLETPQLVGDLLAYIIAACPPFDRRRPCVRPPCRPGSRDAKLRNLSNDLSWRYKTMIENPSATPHSLYIDCS